jgi:hypothetical protein
MASFTFAGAMIFQDNPAWARPSPRNPIRALDKAAIDHALAQTRHDDLKAWEQTNIPYTIRKRRRAFFANLDELQNQKSGKQSRVSTR